MCTGGTGSVNPRRKEEGEVRNQKPGKEVIMEEEGQADSRHASPKKKEGKLTGRQKTRGKFLFGKGQSRQINGKNAERGNRGTM